MNGALRRAVMIAMAACAAASDVGDANAQAVADFYREHGLTILVPSGAGGLNALYAKTVGERWANHIPGNPKVEYRFMPGQGGRKGTNYCYRKAPADASTVCVPFNSFVFAQLVRPNGIEYRAQGFRYLGSASDMNGGIAVWHSVPVKSLSDARKTDVYFIGSGTPSASRYAPLVVNALLGTRFKMVSVSGSGDTLDISGGEGEHLGRAAPLLNWTMRKPHWIESNQIRFLAQVGLRRMPEFPNVPLLTDFARDDAERRILWFVSARAAIGRPFVAPPRTPGDRVAALRTAFAAAMADPVLIADMKARGLHHQWSEGADVRALVARVLATPKPVIDRVRSILGED